ncbi:MAG: hypothetical protein U5K35_17990 [Rhodohalobacter sp.]|nr:hypothetical protein [Rhodohalobacter sp.]
MASSSTIPPERAWAKNVHIEVYRCRHGFTDFSAVAAQQACFGSLFKNVCDEVLHFLDDVVRKMRCDPSGSLNSKRFPSSESLP